MFKLLYDFIYRFCVRYRMRLWFKCLRSVYITLFRNAIVAVARKSVCSFFGLFFVPIMYFVYLHRLKKIPDQTQVFLFSRFDFGPHLVMAHYVRLWQESRGNTCVVILTSDFIMVKNLIKMVSPNSRIICPPEFICQLAVILFGEMNMYFSVFSKLYARLSADIPNAIYIQTQPSSSLYRGYCSPHIEHLDANLKAFGASLPKTFIESYLKGRKILDYKHEYIIDMIRLHSSIDSFESFRGRFKVRLEKLKETLGIVGKYVVMNINTKDYKSKNANRRRIEHVDRYDFLVNKLISNGFSVVIQGRKEQPSFSLRKGLVDYSKSAFCSIENDVVLYSGCSFSVTSRTGGEVFSTLFDVPILGLNYTDLPCVLPNSKYRFYPKKLQSISTNKILSWKDFLNSPCFFNIQANNFEEDIEYLELEKEDIQSALDEFLTLLSGDDRAWNMLTDLQMDFRRMLTPLHMDLYYIPGVPFHSYLAKNLS